MDPIAQMLNEIKNAQVVSKPSVFLSFSNIKYEILKILEQNHFVDKAEKRGRGDKKTIEVFLKYNGKEPSISGFKKVSRPSQKIYLPAKKIRSSRGTLGIVIVSTPKGVMTGREARKKNLGGEVIAEVW